jgi:hypothetical protein
MQKTFIDTQTLDKVKGLSTLDMMQMFPTIISDNKIQNERDTPEFQAWIKQRLGKITGSQFDRIKRDRSGKGWSEGAESYLSELIWEHITGVDAGDFSGSKQTEWGNDNEPNARKWYEKMTNQKVELGNFCKFEGFSLVGCTPDGVGKGGLEIKSPFAAKAHLTTILRKKVPNEYEDQVTGHIIGTERDYCDFFSFDPRFIGKRDDLVGCIVPVERNEFRVEELTERLYDFENELILRLDKLEIEWRK